MKRILSWLLVLALLLPMLALAEEAAPARLPDYAVDFETGDISMLVQSGTCALSVSTSQAHSGAQSLQVSQRTTNNYDAADLKLGSTPVTEGTPFQISCWVYINNADGGQFAIGRAGGDYSYLTTADVPGRTWTKLTAVTSFDKLMNLRFLTVSDSLTGVEYFVDDIEILLNPNDNDTFQNYKSDFSAGLDGWYVRADSGSDTAVSVNDGALTITGRQKDWYSPNHEFDLTPGKNYLISVKVKQDALDKANFLISVQHTLNGVETYENLGTGVAKKGEWTTITGACSAGSFDKDVLYIETKGAPSLEFSIKDFAISKNVLTFGGDIPSLKEMYKDYFDFGAAVVKSEADSPERMEFYEKQFSILTHGNELKPEQVLDIPGCRDLAKIDETAVAVHFTGAKSLLDYAQAHGIKVNGHVLVWHKQTPEAFFHMGYDPNNEYASREIMLARMDNYMRQVIGFVQENYPGVVVSWDVVNEAIDDETGEMRESNLTRTIGYDFVSRCFEIADKYANDDVLLVYNEYSTPYEPKLTGIRKLLDQLVSEGHIDCYGFQCHYAVNTPTMKELRHAFEVIAETGLKLRVTELDITVPDTTDNSFRRQADVYASMMDIFKEYAGQLVSVQTWGVTDDLSWKADGYPLLFDAKAEPKYAFWALTDPTQIPPMKQSGVAYGPAAEADFDKAERIEADGFSFQPLLAEDGTHLLVRVTVKDETFAKTDVVKVFADGINKSVKRGTKNAEEIDGGYMVTVSVPLANAKLGSSVPFDVLVKDGEKTIGWSDNATGTDRVMGELQLQKLLPTATAAYGKDNWADAEVIPCTVAASSDANEGGTVTVNGYALWDEMNLYVKVDVQDAHLDASKLNSWEQDSVEIFLDEKNNRGTSYGKDDHHYRVNFKGDVSVDDGYDTVVATAELTEGGFTAYFTIPFTEEQAAGGQVGFDIRYNNAGADGLRRMLNFCDETDKGWSDPSLFGLLKLVK